MLATLQKRLLLHEEAVRTNERVRELFAYERTNLIALCANTHHSMLAMAQILPIFTTSLQTADTWSKTVSVHAQLLDVFRCVERLSDTDPSSFRRLVQRDSLIAAVPRTDSLPAFKVDTRELLRRLPLHIIACVLAQEPRENGRRSQKALCCTKAGAFYGCMS